MIIDWFSPLPPARSGISRYAVDVLHPLSQIATVRAWTAAAVDKDSLPDIEIIPYSYPDIRWPILNSGDVAIYNLGNNAEFHSPIYRVSLEHSGVVVLHDTYLQDFFRGFYAEQDGPGWQDELERWYGPSARVQSESYLAGLGSFEEISRRFPLTKAAVENALGAVVHNSAVDGELKDLAIAVAQIALPFPSTSRLKQAENKGADTVRLIVFGHIGRNRGLREIVTALASLPNRADFHLDIYGGISNVKAVRELLYSLQISEIVTLHGFVSAEELTAALQRADLAINLRMPSMGETSQSQLEIWSHALPSIVSQTGWYASLPENTVAFVRPDHEVEDLAVTLQRFLSDRTSFVEMGRNGLRFLIEHHQPQHYATALAEFAMSAKDFNAAIASYRLAERVGRKLADTLEDVDTAYLASLVDKIRSLVG